MCQAQNIKIDKNLSARGDVEAFGNPVEQVKAAAFCTAPYLGCTRAGSALCLPDSALASSLAAATSAAPAASPAAAPAKACPCSGSLPPACCGGSDPVAASAAAGVLCLLGSCKGPAARCLADLDTPYLPDLPAPKPVPARLARLPGLAWGAGAPVLSEEASRSPLELSRELMLASESPCMISPDRAPPGWRF